MFVEPFGFHLNFKIKVSLLEQILMKQDDIATLRGQLKGLKVKLV